MCHDSASTEDREITVAQGQNTQITDYYSAGTEDREIITTQGQKHRDYWSSPFSTHTPFVETTKL